MVHLGKGLVVLGLVIVVVGIAMMFAPKIPYLGKLPGDIHIKKDNFEVYIPVVTSLLVSAVVSGALWLISQYLKK
ncbi:MAG: DUF2905 domain-containing protein [Ignavibacteriales bacterium]|nr:DUF2905 domain-containing protein [Ignavibacteriales bacterium]